MIQTGPRTMTHEELRGFLNDTVLEFNNRAFVKNDPVCIPHSFTRKQDIEIAAFFSAIFAWGNRTTIINKSRELIQLMDNSPYHFCLDHSDNDLKKLLHFKHRTFNTTDLLYFIAFLKFHYSGNKSLETAFFNGTTLASDATSPTEVVERALNYFYEYFFSLPDVPVRTKKHIAAPSKKATCKRLNMFLRWMVRNDKCGVDFGLWKKINPSQLICPVDVHVARVARKFNLLQQTGLNWEACLQLTRNLRQLDAEDPVKYDFALFGLGVVRHY